MQNLTKFANRATIWVIYELRFVCNWFNQHSKDFFELFMTLLTVRSFLFYFVLFPKVPLKWHPISRLIWFLQCLSAVAYRFTTLFLLPKPRFFLFVAFYLRTFFLFSHIHFFRQNEFYAFTASWVMTVSWVWHTWANHNDDAKMFYSEECRTVFWKEYYDIIIEFSAENAIYIFKLFNSCLSKVFKIFYL